MPRGDMPGSVQLSRGCFTAVGLYFGLNLMGCLFSGADAEELLLSAVIPLSAIAIMLVCVRVRTQLARRGCRFMALTSAVMMTLALIAVIELMFRPPAGTVVSSSTSYYGIPISESVRPAFELFMVGSIAAVALGLWIPVFALGRRSARTYFSGPIASLGNDN
ncbi:hypothetical protein Pla123a_18080 [Posidoniimonas polymericola]|uniref:Uncharacterized protein n=2 Tax=Posidoniimonas polymericola TaxID=2528002 RepID=A0A5C5YSW0_9BACT|nr:hypothetical protein Pla123a_18080 [Posidoniimonas polymericola]